MKHIHEMIHTFYHASVLISISSRIPLIIPRVSYIKINNCYSRDWLREDLLLLEKIRKEERYVY